ncbi:MAG: NAD(P)/FAD-dependent oxidoreductase [Methanophagales archaeon]|nr:NAD(P)/FAD-dependent oxidoreductase [Methanophagales archaeon]
MKCDVLVVGAGPAGSSAARAAAEAGAKTIFIDKKKEIGVPVQCGECIGKYLFPYLPFKIPKEQLIWKLDGVSFWADDITIERTGGIWSSYAINRKKFDKWLADNAVDAGAKLLTNAELVDLDVKEGYDVRKAMVKTSKGEIVIEPKVVIAADGVDSTVLKLLGFIIDKNQNCGEILSYEMKNLNIEKPKYDQVFIGNFAPGAYGYIFPKSESTANIGVGRLFQEKDLSECFEEFLEVPQVKRQLKNGITVEEKNGWAPFRYVAENWVYGTILLCGDSANQNFKPFVEGFLPAIICGDIAGKTAFDYLNDKTSLDIYMKNINAKLGVLFRESDMLSNLMYDLVKSSDKKERLLLLGISTNVLSLYEIGKLKDKNYNTIKNGLKEWNSSKIKQFSTIISEKLNLLYSLLRSKR